MTINAIDIEELQMLAQDFKLAGQPMFIQTTQMIELLDRLKAAESASRDDYQNWMTALGRNAELLAKLEAAEKENKALREALAEKVTSETILRDLSVGNGSIRASFEGGAVHLLVDAFAGQFSESGAENYLEMHFHSPATGPLVTTVQRVNGKTPHQLREAAEKERDELRAKVEQMEQQAPVGWLFDGDFYEVRQMSLYKDNEPLQGQTALYTTPGAKGE